METDKTTIATLAELSKAIREDAANRGLIVYEDMPELTPEYPVAAWQGEWTAFLDLAQRADASILYLAETPFDWEAELRDRADEAGLLDDVDETAPLGDADAWLLARLRERTEEWMDQSGGLSTVSCAWFKDNVAHLLRREAVWFPAFDDATEAILMDAEAVRVKERRLHSEEEGRVLFERAKELAQHPRYREATSETKREYMTEQVFPEMSQHACQRIASLSTLVYWWEVEPVERVSNAERARELYAAGESMTSIAALLQISREKVKAALADAKDVNN